MQGQILNIIKGDNQQLRPKGKVQRLEKISYTLNAKWKWWIS